MNTNYKILMVAVICLICSLSINANILFGGIYYYELQISSYYLRYVVATYPSGHSLGDASYPSLNGALQINSYFYPGLGDIHYKVYSIGKNAFEYCTGLSSVTIGGQGPIGGPYGLISIDERAFQGCTGLKSVTIGQDVKSIGKWAFYGCSGLTHLVIGERVEEIEYTAFVGCNNIRHIYIRAINPPDLGYRDIMSISTWDSFNFFQMRNNATLHVPEGCVDKYKKHDFWGEFYNIVEEMSGVDDVTIDEMPAVEVERFTINGRKISSPTPGINVIRYSDGSTLKTLVR